MVALATRQYGGKGRERLIFKHQDVRELADKDRFDVVFSNAVLHYGFHGPKAYTRWLLAAGLTPLRVELIEKDMRHQGRDGLAGWIRTTWLPYLERVPKASRELFIQEIVAAYLQSHAPDPDDTVHVRMMRLEVAAIKA